MKKVYPFIFFFFFFSGISSLIYEVVWIRLLTLILGNTVFGVSAVLSAFMGGLAIGSYIAGRIVDNKSKPLLIYAILEILIGLVGFLVSILLSPTGSLYVFLHQLLGHSPLLINITKYVFSFCLLAVPTMMMGATLPVLSKYVVKNELNVGMGIGSLYTINTLGAATGCYLAGFVMIGNIGVWLTICIASGLSILIGSLALICYLATNSIPEDYNIHARSSFPSEKEGSSVRPLFKYFILFAISVSGFAALGYEIIWTRILIFFIGNTVYAFTAMLTTFLIGIALGSLLFSRFADRQKLLVASFGLIEIAIGIYPIVIIYLISRYSDGLALFTHHIRNLQWDYSELRFLRAFILMFIPTFLFGATFPVAVRLYSDRYNAIAHSVGNVYSWNTLGSILGSVVTGFFLMPVIGLEKSLILLACLNITIGIVLCALEPGLSYTKKSVLACLLIPILVFGFYRLPEKVFHKMQTAEMRNRYAPGSLLYYSEDIAGTVSVYGKEDKRTLYIDNVDVAGLDLSFLSSHMPLAHIPMLLHPNPKNIFIIGFGGGGTTYSMSTYPEVAKIDVAELNSTVVQASHFFRSINNDIANSPIVNISINDGRNFLLTAKEKYDVISVDLLLPQTAGAGSLYTEEFYQLCFSRLNEDGIMVQWIHPYAISLDNSRIIVNTVRQVFPHVSLWWSRRHGHLILVVSKKPPRIDFQRLIQRMNYPATKRDLEKISFNDPYTFLSYYIASNGELTEFLNGTTSLNTDDLPVIEYGAPLAKPIDDNYQHRLKLLLANSSILPWITNIDEEQKERVLLYEETATIVSGIVLARLKRDGKLFRENCFKARKLNPSYIDTIELCSR